MRWGEVPCQHEDMTDAWRPIAATLADEGRRLAWARIVLGAANRSPVQVSALTARAQREVRALERAGLVTVLSSDPAIEVVAQAPDGPTAVSLAVDLRPDVVLMDVEMPGGDGITAIAQLRERAPTVHRRRIEGSEDHR